MLPYEFYKVSHMIGIALLIMGLTGVTFAFAMGVPPKKIKILGFATHGLGLLFILISGFGMAARLGMITGLPDWVKAKIGVWIVAGLCVSLAKRQAKQAPLLLGLFAVLVGTAAWLAIYKPF